MPIDHENSALATCPACGQADRDSWEMTDGEVVECDCGATYEVMRNITVTFTTRLKNSARVEKYFSLPRKRMYIVSMDCETKRENFIL
jgi:Zn ribbon nucleic-acid-binding protein